MTMRKYLIFSMLCVALCANAQTSGVRVDAALPFTESFQPGAGSSAEWWVNWPIGDHRQIHMALGVQHYAGYQGGIIEHHSQYGPTELLISNSQLELNALTFATLQAGYRWEKESRWAWTLAARAGYQFHSEGFTTSQQRWYSFRRNSRDPLVPELFPELKIKEFNGNRSSRGSNFTVNDHLRRYDAGLLASLHYRITEGLEAEAAYYQGLFNQWKLESENPPVLRVAALSFGLSLRLF